MVKTKRSSLEGGLARSLSLFQALAASMLSDGRLSPAEREFLSEWENDPLAETTWRTIQTNAHKHRDLRISGGSESDRRAFWAQFDRGIIGQILLVKLLADRADIEWERRGYWNTCALKAEELVKALEEPLAPGLPSPILVNGDFVQELKRVAENFRRRAQLNLLNAMKISRQNSGSSRVRVAFMSLMSAEMLALCGQSLDDVVASLTDIAFGLDEPTTAAMVRSARTSQKGRRRKN